MNNLLMINPGTSFLHNTACLFTDFTNSCVNSVISCDVFSPGSHDFAAGLEFLKGLEKDANYPFVSANIFGKYGEKIFDLIALNILRTT